MESIRPEITSLTLKAMQCRTCFEEGLVKPATIDLAQPRWIGPEYWSSARRVVILLINPGSGARYVAERNHRDRALLQRALHEPSALIAYLEQQRQDLPEWGRGKFWGFFMSKLGLDLDAIALANIAWCASREDSYPKAMLETCFERFSRHYLGHLDPDVLILCGAAAHRFHDHVRSQLPHAKILRAIHYAHRQGAAAERVKVDELKNLLESLQVGG